MKPPASLIVVLLLSISTALLADDRSSKPTVNSTFAAEAARQALERYEAEVAEIERVAALRKAKARERLLASLQQAERVQAEKGPRYRGMLGSYYDQRGRVPYILLSVPDGQNVLGGHVWSVMNKRRDVRRPMYKFESRGHVRIPAKGKYRLEAGLGTGELKLNGEPYALSQKKVGQPQTADVVLDQGVYEIEFVIGNNGGQMNRSLVRVRDLKTDEPLPIFVYESDLKKFWGDLSLGVELHEVSGWTMKANRLE